MSNESSPQIITASRAPNASSTLTPGASSTRRRLLGGVAVLVLGGLAAWAVLHLLHGGGSEETDDAYVAGHIVTVTSRDPGTVIAVRADDTQRVRAGEVLVELDPANARAQVAFAEAELARAVRKVRGDRERADAAGAAVARAQADVARAEGDVARRRGAVAEGAASGEEVSHAEAELTAARTALTMAERGRGEAEAGVAGTDVAHHPEVQAAAARLKLAELTLRHMRVDAPMAGVVAQRRVQLGQRVEAGTPLLAVVPLQAVWVDANFRETQLGHIRIGQRATVVSDVYGGDVVYHGRVVGLGAGSGSAFAVLPPQNASGNWIKVVQRLPVRIALDARELAAHPLRVGLSVTATVDTRAGDDAAAPPPGAAVGADPAVAAALDAADARRVDAIIAANGGAH